MNTKSKLAFGCNVLAIVLIAALALNYLLTPHLLSYQEAAIGVPWSELNVGLQIQFLSLLKVSGGGYLATAICLGVLLQIPWRRGEAWARTTIPAIGIPAILVVNYAGLSIIRNTPGRPPLMTGPIVILLLIAGFVLSADMVRRRSAHLS